MRKTQDPAAIRSSLSSRATLIAHGWTDHQIRAAVRAKAVHRLHHGWYMPHALWDGLFWEQQHLAHLMAVIADAEPPGPVAANVSAAVAHKLPLFRMLPERVHLICEEGVRISSTRDVLRHFGSLMEEDVVEVDGIRCTSLARTVVDVARTSTLETAVACADAALRSVAAGAGSWDFDEDAAAALRNQMHAVLGSMPGVRGARRARWVVDFADGRAQLPGESVARLRLAQVGIRTRRLQVAVDGPDGTTFYVDADTEEGWLEFDGMSKYLDEAMRRGSELEQVLLEEKRREDWIRARTGRRVLRVRDDDIGTVRAFIERLAVYGIRPPLRRPNPDPGPPASG